MLQVESVNREVALFLGLYLEQKNLVHTYEASRIARQSPSERALERGVGGEMGGSKKADKDGRHRKQPHLKSGTPRKLATHTKHHRQ